MIFSNKNIVFTLVFLALVTSSANNTFAMQLSFYLNNLRQIIAYGANEDMKYYEKPETFTGKDILDVLPLSNDSREEILNQFILAKEKKIITYVNYTLENSEYTSKIIPLCGKEGDSYFVKVTNKKIN